MWIKYEVGILKGAGLSLGSALRKLPRKVWNWANTASWKTSPGEGGRAGQGVELEAVTGEIIYNPMK